MNAVGISENDEILVREQPEVENGQLAVVMVNGPVGAALYEALTKAGALGFLSIPAEPPWMREKTGCQGSTGFPGNVAENCREPASIIWMPVKS